jgi:hypothetical protein
MADGRLTTTFRSSSIAVDPNERKNAEERDLESPSLARIQGEACKRGKEREPLCYELY